MSENKGEWIVLNINDIPNDFFNFNKYNYTRRVYSSRTKHKWETQTVEDIKDLLILIEVESLYSEPMIMYQAKPLEPQRISKELLRMLEVELIEKGYYDLLHAKSDSKGHLIEIDNRPVEIID